MSAFRLVFIYCTIIDHLDSLPAILALDNEAFFWLGTNWACRFCLLAWATEPVRNANIVEPVLQRVGLRFVLLDLLLWRICCKLREWHIPLLCLLFSYHLLKILVKAFRVNHIEGHVLLGVRDRVNFHSSVLWRYFIVYLWLWLTEADSHGVSYCVGGIKGVLFVAVAVR